MGLPVGHTNWVTVRKKQYGGFQKVGIVGSGPGILKTLPGSGSGDMSPTPYSPGRVGPDLTLPLLTWTQGPPSPQWAGVPAARPLEEVGVISGPVPREPLTKMQ